MENYKHLLLWTGYFAAALLLLYGILLLESGSEKARLLYSIRGYSAGTMTYSTDSAHNITFSKGVVRFISRDSVIAFTDREDLIISLPAGRRAEPWR